MLASTFALTCSSHRLYGGRSNLRISHVFYSSVEVRFSNSAQGHYRLYIRTNVRNRSPGLLFKAPTVGCVQDPRVRPFLVPMLWLTGYRTQSMFGVNLERGWLAGREKPLDIGHAVLHDF